MLRRHLLSREFWFRMDALDWGLSSAFTMSAASVMALQGMGSAWLTLPPGVALVVFKYVQLWKKFLDQRGLRRRDGSRVLDK